jgi:flagellar basal-body rod modification protein FlgD
VPKAEEHGIMSIGSTPSAGSAAAGSSSNTSTTTATLSNPSLNMTPEDFMNIMVTQLENQDPLDPTSASDLLQQVSQIGQLSASDSLQTSMQSMSLQSQIGASSSLIGKSVTGLDASGNSTSGLVNSVQVQSDGAYLQLDNGDTVSLTNVSAIGTSSSGSSTTPSTSSGSSGSTSAAAAAETAEQNAVANALAGAA